MFKKIEDILEIVIKIAITILLVSLTALVSYTVILRFFFDSGFPAGEELCRYIFVWSAFLGVVLGVKLKAHMCITFFEDKFPKLRIVGKVMYYLSHFAFFGILAYYGTEFVNNAVTAKSTLLPITMNYVYAAVPACGYVCLFIVLLKLIQEFIPSGALDDTEKKEA